MKTSSRTRNTQQALFGSAFAEWKKDADRAFDHWLARRGVSESSAEIYGFMWRKWLRWTAERKLSITAWEAHHIGEFLDDSDLHKHHRYRYARLIERVFQHLATLRPGMHNPASVAVQQKLADGENAPTTFLMESERKAGKGLGTPQPIHLPYACPSFFCGYTALFSLAPEANPAHGTLG
ncbi:hypothetical protein [Cupriavidus necator]|uniref:hypothetical protein n=1 Tax=Cupriavidus necator TaxID=106590 RepID=UPI00068A79D1|nr:hypothetical protein [Cupriavidus necator]